MTVTALEYEDRQRRWKLERTEFGPFNLLVGVSGAGKTSVLNALLEVSVMGSSQPGARHPGGKRRWCIEVHADDGHDYLWEAEVAVQESATLPPENWYEDYPWSVRFLQERITRDGDIVVRRDDEFWFQSSKLPQLKSTESAIALLAAEPLVTPLHRALGRILVSGQAHPYATMFLQRTHPSADTLASPASAATLRDEQLPILLKAYLARLYFPDVFEHIRAQYLAIFDNVTDLTVALVDQLDPTEAQHESAWLDDKITLAIQERGVDGWITGRHMSSGMLRTFFHIAELELSPPGSTFVIDEYENSMGVNCLPAITDLFLRRQYELQFVLTSHHPYVIQNIPIDWWRVVTRRGGVVSVRPASEIPELNTRSRQDAFTMLVNSSVYEEGIQ